MILIIETRKDKLAGIKKTFASKKDVHIIGDMLAGLVRLAGADRHNYQKVFCNGQEVVGKIAITKLIDDYFKVNESLPKASVG